MCRSNPSYVVWKQSLETLTIGNKISYIGKTEIRNKKISLETMKCDWKLNA